MQLILSSHQTRRLASAISRLVRTEEDLESLRQAVPIGTGFWAQQLFKNMHRRFTGIFEQLETNRGNVAQGEGIVWTIDQLRALFRAVDTIRADHFATMTIAERQPFVELLINVLKNRLLNNDDLYANFPHTAYAGEACKQIYELHSRRKKFFC